MKKLFVLILFLFSMVNIFAKKTPKKPVVDDRSYDLTLSTDDIFVLPEDENHLVKDGNGAHLFIKKRGDIQSVALLVKSDNYNDPDLSLMRAREFNAVNGNEFLYYRGSKSNFRMERLANALISSRAETSAFGECFHIYIPKKMYYGYVIQVQNECEFENGMTVSVRAFSEKHCDSAGKTTDNILPLNLSDWQTEEAFAQIAGESDGKLIHIIKISDLSKKLIEEVDEIELSEKVDFVFAIDATDSMRDDFVELKKNWLPKFEKQMKKFKDVRIGLLFYKDYGDEFSENGLPVKKMGFQKDAKAFSKAVKTVSVRGGGDKEEAVYEALHFCTTRFEWRSEAKKKIILIGDAPPHPKDNEAFTSGFDVTATILSEKNIQIDCFLITSSNEKTKGMKSIDKNNVTEELIKSVDYDNIK